MKPIIEVRAAGKEFELVVNGHVIGTNKLNCDAMFHKHFLDELFEKVQKESNNA
jgi:hypothetical protein